MDLIGKLVGGQGCGADGTTSARNPLARLVDSVLDSAPVSMASHTWINITCVTTSLVYLQASQRPEGRGPSPGAQAANASAGGNAFHAGLREAAGEGGRIDGPPPPPPPPRAMMPRGRGRGRGGMMNDPWASEFMANEMHVPPQAR